MNYLSSQNTEAYSDDDIAYTTSGTFILDSDAHPSQNTGTSMYKLKRKLIYTSATIHSTRSLKQVLSILILRMFQFLHRWQPPQKSQTR